MDQKIQVAVVSGHTVFQHQVSSQLANIFRDGSMLGERFEVKRVADEDALRKLLRQVIQPRLIVTDARMLGAERKMIITQMSACCPQSLVIVGTTPETDPEEQALVKAGATDVVCFGPGFGRIVMTAYRLLPQF